MKKSTILIVEDEQIIALDIENCLKRSGYQVQAIVDSGERAIQIAKETRPDIILMDIRLNGEIDGIEAARTICSQNTIPIIFLTAYAEQDKLERAKLTLPFGYLLKPVQERDLNITIEMSLYAATIDSERRQAVEALKKSEKQYQDLFNSILNGFAIHEMVRDEKGNPIDFRFLKVNPAYERLTTLKSEDIIGKTLLEILPNTEHHWIDTYNTVVESGTPIRFEDYSPELKKHWEIYAFRNQPNQFACVISDITDIKLAKQVWQKAYDELEKRVDERTIDLKNAIKSAEFAKKEAEKANHAKSEFISVISHELRTPMHGILSFSKFGVEKFDKLPREEIIGFFHDIRTSAVRMMSLLNDLLDLAKLESGKMNYSYETTDVEPIIQSAISELSLTAEKRKIEIELIVGRPLKPVKCDGQRIRQVLLNLLSNALKFTEPKKQITVFCEKKSADRAVQEETVVEEQISIKISDNGPGIPENNLRNIFNKFIQCGNHTSDTKGTGLGLAICKEIITAHGGEIWAENNVDGGASFCFTLPLPHK